MSQTIKIATFNVEWMVNLFRTKRPELLTEHNPRSPGLGSKPKDPMGVARRIASVIQEVDADIVGICEGPPLKAQMRTFARRMLDNEYDVFSMEDGSQSVHVLVRRSLEGRLKVSQLPPKDKVFERLRLARQYYKFGSVKTPAKQAARFTRLPVVLRLERKGKVTEIMALHTKSKISQLKKAVDWEKKSAAKVIDAINSRQKLSIEMNVVRKYIAHRLWSQQADAVIVMGDFNDGISRDVVDETYLLHSIVHELRGGFQHELAIMRHVLSPEQLQKKSDAWTVEFSDATRGNKKTRVLLDHMLYSPRCQQGGSICFKKGSGRIEHDAYNKFVERKGQSRDERPSDHKPLSAKFVLI